MLKTPKFELGKRHSEGSSSGKDMGLVKQVLNLNEPQSKNLFKIQTFNGKKSKIPFVGKTKNTSHRSRNMS